MSHAPEYIRLAHRVKTDDVRHLSCDRADFCRVELDFRPARTPAQAFENKDRASLGITQVDACTGPVIAWGTDLRLRPPARATSRG